MNNLNAVFWVLMTISAVALIAFAATVITWSVKFFAANRPVRKQRQMSIPQHYGRLASAH